MKKLKILYIQHAATLGGSCMSLLYTLQALDPDLYHPVVALIRPSEPVARLYREAGFEVIEWPGIRPLEHTSAAWASLFAPRSWSGALATLLQWKRSKRRTLELVERIAPDLVHLNSVVLVPAALALHEHAIPFVWHIRESPTRGHLSLRTGYIKKRLQQLGQELIFISDYDRQSWVEGRRGVVIHNFVDFNRFDRHIDGRTVRAQLAIPPDARVILFLGGLAEIKGIFPLLEALALLRSQMPEALCLMPSAVYQPTRLIPRAARLLLPLVGSATRAQRVERRIAELGIDDMLIRLPYQTAIAPFLAASDLLVFPSIEPHFARPVMEAAAMAKPSVGSDLGGVRELIEPGRTGLLVEPGNPAVLAEALLSILRDRMLAARMGENGYRKARAAFDAEQQIKRIEQLYERIKG